jgi:proton glutamate symport protein
VKLKPHWQIIISLLLATLLGYFFRQFGKDAGVVESSIKVLTLLGDLFMGLLKMIIVPLVASSVISGIASLHGVKGFGRMLGKTTGFYALSSLLAICLGLLLVNVIQPGLVDGASNETIRAAITEREASPDEVAKIADAKITAVGQAGFFDQLSGFFVRMIPTNVIEAAASNGQMLGLIFFCICFAIAMTRLPVNQIQPIRDVIVSINDTMIVLTQSIMKLAPIGVFALIVPVVYQTGIEIFSGLGKYFFTVLLALGIHLFVVMPVLLRVLAGVNPLDHFRGMQTALLTAFSTASSSATLPVTMRCIQENAGVSKGTASFTLPLGATVNMDGTALYECVAVMFVAQVMGIEMSLAAQFMVVLSALLTSIGVAGIPSASLVAILIILNNSGIPNADKAVIVLLSVDRLLDMTRTAVNVFGDSCAAIVIARSEGEMIYKKS